MAFNLAINVYGGEPTITVNYWLGTMANKTLWATETVTTLLATELNNLADNAFAIDGGTYDNATNKFRWADFLLFLDDFDAAPDSGGYFELHAIHQIDGSNYGDNNDGDGDADSVPDGNTLIGIFPVQATDADQYIQCCGVQLSPFVTKFAVKNKCGQDLTPVDTHWLKIAPYNEELQ